MNYFWMTLINFRSWKPIRSGRHGLSRMETMFEMRRITIWRRMHCTKYQIQCETSQWSIWMPKCTWHMSKSYLWMWFGFCSIHREKWVWVVCNSLISASILDAAEWNTKYWAMDMGGYQHFNTTQCIEPTGGNYKARCCANTLSGSISKLIA